MENRLEKNMNKWEEENKLLETIRENLTRYSALKDEKGDKDDIDRCNAKITGIIEENGWMKLDWKEIKRSRASRAEGLSKVEKKISDRQKKLNEGQQTLSLEAAGSGEGSAVETKDWSSALEECQEGSVYYHWVYGKMEVVFIEGNYLYLKLLDKKGIRAPWIDQNNVLVEVDGKVDEMKEFSLYSIGRWLFPEAEDVRVTDKNMAHRLFQK